MNRPKVWIGLTVLLLAACVSLEEMHIPKAGIHQGQRTVVAVFGSPAPLMTQEENKAEKLGSITPGLSLVLAGAENERDNAASKDLAQYLPPFDIAKEFDAALKKELPKAGHPGKLISPDEADISTDTLTRFNAASDISDWRYRYMVQNPDNPLPRNYETLLQLNDALVLEVDVANGLIQDDAGNASPNLTSVTKLFRVDGMHLLWRHENYVEDKAGARLVYDFKTEPADLLKKWRALITGLAAKIVEDYRKELSAAGLYNPYTPPANVATSTAAPTGWYAVPELPGARYRQGGQPAPVSPPANPTSLPGMSASSGTTTAPPTAAVEVPPLLMAPPPDAIQQSSGTKP